jgi:hypothetical protein
MLLPGYKSVIGIFAKSRKILLQEEFHGFNFPGNGRKNR